MTREEIEARLAEIEKEIAAIQDERMIAWAAAGQDTSAIPGRTSDPEQIAKLERDDEAAWAEIQRLAAERDSLEALLRQEG